MTKNTYFHPKIEPFNQNNDKLKTIGKMSHKVSFRDFDPSKLVFEKTDEKSTTANGQTITYYIISIKYNYDVVSSDGRVTIAKGPLFIEAPKMKSRGPNKKSYEDKGKDVWSCFTRYDLSNPEHAQFVERTTGKEPGTLHKLCMGCCKEVFQRGRELKLSSRNVDAVLDLMHYPVLWKMDMGEPIPGENPASIWKLMRYGKEPNVRETAFYLPIDNGRKASWELLSNSNIVHQPLIKVDNITVAGGRPSIKMEIFSSVIYDIIESGPENLQQQTIESAAKDADTLKLLERIKELEGKLGSTSVSGGGSAGMSNDPEPAYNASASSLASASATPDVIPGLPMAVPAPVAMQAPVALPVLPQAPAPVVLPPAPVAVMPPPVALPTLPVLPAGPPVINIAEPLP
jgi:hypothetical protein